MELKLSKRESQGVAVLDVNGRITAGTALAALRDAIRDEVAKGNHSILINLQDVSYIDSSGLGELVMALGTVTQTICGSCGATLFKDDDGQWEPCPQCASVDRRPWGQLKLVNAGRQVTDLLQFTKLNTVFEVHESESDAIASFAKGRRSGASH
ncbi:MAG TPA: STAS domain-containing protein [Terriglobia bacterium]|nr:STAS domain-containing protein [Terriglobia bacterium]